MARRDFLHTAGRATIALGSATLWSGIADLDAADALDISTARAERGATDLAGAWRFRTCVGRPGRNRLG